MKDNRKITRIRLNVGGHAESMMFGLVTPDPDYKLSLKLNKKLRISLKNASPVEIEEAGGVKASYSRFSSAETEHHTHFNLVSNRAVETCLLKNLRNIDYILVLYDHENQYDPEHLAGLIREVENVTAVLKLDLKVLKDKALIQLGHLP